MTIPNILTCIRISLIPILVLVFYIPFAWHGGMLVAIFILAALTDWLDGYLARRLQQISPLGTFLDPVADKLLVAVALILLVERYATPWLTIPALVIVGREIMVSALREWMAELGKRRHVSVSQIGKYKTAAQMSAIVLLLVLAPTPGAVPVFKGWYYLAYCLMYASMLLTLWSMVIYLKAAWIELRSAKIILR
jgi:CDP-diacylglycerol---glycerol-3-phosphate 3-phosphatidyltransferase